VGKWEQRVSCRISEGGGRIGAWVWADSHPVQGVDVLSVDHSGTKKIQSLSIHVKKECLFSIHRFQEGWRMEDGDEMI
jgi:hypothetical protein